MTFITINSGAVATPIEDIGNLIGHDGWLLPPLRIVSESGPLQHGETYRDFRLKARTGLLALRLRDTGLDTMYTKRDALSRVFYPGLGISLDFAIGADTRRIDGVVEKITAGWEVKDWGAQKVVIAVFCADPTFYDPVGEAITIQADYDSSGGEIPAPVPLGVGSSVLNKAYTISYTGTWSAFPIVRITGPVTNPVLSHGETGDKLDFTGTTISAGDYREIDLRYGYKTVIDSTGANKISELTSDSDLSTFCIVPVTPGETAHDNTLTATGSAISVATRVDLSFFTRYLAI